MKSIIHKSGNNLPRISSFFKIRLKSIPLSEGAKIRTLYTLHRIRLNKIAISFIRTYWSSSSVESFFYFIFSLHSTSFKSILLYDIQMDYHICFRFTKHLRNFKYIYFRNEKYEKT